MIRPSDLREVSAADVNVGGVAPHLCGAVDKISVDDQPTVLLAIGADTIDDALSRWRQTATTAADARTATGQRLSQSFRKVDRIGGS